MFLLSYVKRQYLHERENIVLYTFIVCRQSNNIICRLKKTCDIFIIFDSSGYNKNINTYI